MPIAASNLTTAVTAHAQALDVFTDGIEDVANSLEQWEPDGGLPDFVLKAQARLRDIVANMKSEALVMNHLASQMPQGSTAATTSAAIVTPTEAIGKAGDSVDETEGPATGPGTVPNEEIEGSGIIGLHRENIAPGAPQSLSKDDEKKEA